jgi:hypothetical protein
MRVEVHNFMVRSAAALLWGTLARSVHASRCFSPVSEPPPPADLQRCCDRARPKVEPGAGPQWCASPPLTPLPANATRCRAAPGTLSAPNAHLSSCHAAGTGKSSLVCAICVGLAGKTTLLGRAEDVSSFVRRGASSGWVQITLSSGDPMRPHVVGTGRGAQERQFSIWLSQPLAAATKWEHAAREAAPAHAPLPAVLPCPSPPLSRCAASCSATPTRRIGW